MEEAMREEAKRLAFKDAEKADIQTTSEGKAFLHARFKYHMGQLRKNHDATTV